MGHEWKEAGQQLSSWGKAHPAWATVLLSLGVASLAAAAAALAAWLGHRRCVCVKGGLARALLACAVLLRPALWGQKEEPLHGRMRLHAEHGPTFQFCRQLSYPPLPAPSPAAALQAHACCPRRRQGQARWYLGRRGG